MLDDEHCRQLATPSITNFVVSCLILVGLIGSYLPQHYRIIARRSSEGLSPYFVLLGVTSGTCSIANILTLPTSREDIACCSVNDTFPCVAGLLGIAQISVQWSCWFFIMFLYLIFIPRPVSRERTNVMPKNVLVALVIVGICIFHFVITLLASIIILARFPQSLQTWADFLGVLGGILASTQYFPQIYTTWRLQKVGSLSIVMMCIQTPGGFLFAASLAARLGPSGWSAWAIYVVLATLQGILLAMCISFEIRDWRARKELESQRSLNGRGVGQTPASGTVFDTDDEGGDRIEGDQENAPLLKHDRLRQQRGVPSSED